MTFFGEVFSSVDAVGCSFAACVELGRRATTRGCFAFWTLLDFCRGQCEPSVHCGQLHNMCSIYPNNENEMKCDDIDVLLGEGSDL
eukprot:scaffold1112_cov195-Alexandrium_tamarense.AAC.7